MLEAADALCGHNVIPFDIPAIQKLYPSFRPTGRVHDTLVYTRLIYPHLAEIDAAAIRKGRRPADFRKLAGSHKLEAWGIRLGENKGDYGEVRKAKGLALGLQGADLTRFVWGDFNEEMEEYAAQDVVVTKALWELIETKFPGTENLIKAPPPDVELEHDTALIIFMQERFGFLFDDAGAEELEGVLRARKAELEDQLRAVFPPWQEPERKGGRPVQFVPKRDNAKLGYTAGVPIQRYKTVSFNPASRDHIANRLTTLFGWQPVEFTDSGKPKVDETTLSGMDFDEAKLLVEYLTVDKRLGQLAEGKQAWRKAVRIQPGSKHGRIHGRVNSLGAITRRMTHSTPNMAQVPAVRAPYGKQCRALFTVAVGNRLVGCDAEGLELRMLAHFMARFDGGAYVNTVVNGSKDDGTDVHTVNQRFIGLNSRDSAKTWIYAYLYGAGNLKLGSIMYDDFTEARRAQFNAKFPAGDPRDRALSGLGLRARKRIESGLPALGALQEKVKQLAARRYLKTVDGGHLRVRSAHAALNTLLQGGGAVVMKKALVILYQHLLKEGFVPDYLKGTLTSPEGDVIGFVCNVHDEVQMEAPEHLAEWLGQVAAEAIRLAGVAFNLRCPLAGAYQVGDTWADSH